MRKLYLHHKHYEGNSAPVLRERKTHSETHVHGRNQWQPSENAWRHWCNKRALLSQDSAEMLNLIKTNQDAIVSEINTVSPQLHINKDVQPTSQPHRKEPFHLRNKIKAEMKKLEDLGIIKDAVGSNPGYLTW